MASSASHAERYSIPLFAASPADGGAVSVLRLVNRSMTPATASVQAVDDSGNVVGASELTLAAMTTVEFAAGELAAGNADKGLASGLGPLAGEVRLIVESDAPESSIIPSVYMRDAGGALFEMQSSVLGTTGIGHERSARYQYPVTLFRAAGSLGAQSRLRLVNAGAAAANVRVSAKDDFGAPGAGEVRLTLPAGGARTLDAAALESGDAANFSGRLGAGLGLWRLFVASDVPIEVLHVTAGAGGDLRNLSGTAVAGLAPDGAAAFEERFLGRALIARDGTPNRTEIRILGDRGFVEVDIEEGSERAAFRRVPLFENRSRCRASAAYL